MVKVIRTRKTGSSDKEHQAQAVLQKLRKTSIEEEAASLASTNGLPYIDLHIFPIDPEDIFLIPEEDARRLNIVLFNKKQTTVRFALTRPTAKDTLEYIKTLSETKGWEPELYVVSEPSLERALVLYARRTFIDNLDLVRVSLQGKDLEQFENDLRAITELKENRAINTSRAMEIIIAGSRKFRASDIHIEPEEASARLRYRIDGVLQDIGALPLEIYRLILSRVKMIAKMRLNVRNRAQDGHFFIDLDNQRIDVRVNSIPGKYGESLNMRLLSADDVIGEVDRLGLRGLAYEEVLKQVNKPNGMILNTGPTGSGKTTTLYTLLHKINEPGTKIITVEDPIEYTLPGIVQTEVSKDKTYTFATALRAIVRQDPDVILVGEIRDEETADIAINAALTGHLVLSTLHANDAAAAVPRLIELGVKPSLIGSAINAFVAQRLVRCLCPECKTSYEPAKETIGSIIRLVTIISPKAKVSLPKAIGKLWKAVGCSACHMTGYRGRIGIFEVFTVTPEMQDIIDQRGTDQDIMKAALENGMVTMTQDGILKALEGMTTLDEVWRVTDQRDTLVNLYTELMPSELARASHIAETLSHEVSANIDSLATLGRYLQSLDSKLRLPAIFAAAVALKTGDIHIEPAADAFEVRFRIDGILSAVVRFPINEYPSLLSEIKLLGGLKSGERAGITDSRFSVSFEQPIDASGTTNVDVRLSIILGGFGETAVMRLLNQGAIRLQLEALDLRPTTLKNILAAIGKPNGIVLTTGPTGSGKTTTLYSILSRLNRPEIKIITVEDPIEYQIPGILQTQVNEGEEYSFATALRSLLRQNPDILMIGEIRDDKTARIAVQAAATGHLVLSTLHSNSAAGAVSRLLNMGVSGDDLANAANLFMAQRLVRRLCDACKVAVTPNVDERALIDTTFRSLSPASGISLPSIEHIFTAKGCPKCNGTGFSSQVALTETLPVTRAIQELIARNALTKDIEDRAVAEGMITLSQDGILAVLEGKTTLDEVKRVTDI